MLDLHQLRRVDPIALDMIRTALQTAIRRGGTLSTAGLRPSLEDAVYPLISRGLRLHEMVSDALLASHDRTDARQ